MNNALNSISMQAELARMYADRGDHAKANEALLVVMEQCRKCSVVTRNAHGLLEDESSPSV